MKKIFTILVLTMAIVTGKAQVLYEPFNYSPSATNGLAIQSGVWLNINTGDSILVEAGNLSYSGLSGSSGNRITYGGSGTDCYRSFSSQTSGTVYFSFLLNVTSLGTITTTGGYTAGFIDNTTTNFNTRLWLRLSGTSNYNVGINPGSVAANTQWSPAVLAPNTTYLVVASLQFVAGTSNDIAKIWINPVSLGGTEPASDATATNTAATDPSSIQRFFFRQDNTSNTPGTLVIDELRVGTTWADVTPSSTTPTISSSTNSITLVAPAAGVASPSQAFTVSGSNLSPASGSIAVQPSANFELSSDNISFGPSSINLPYTGGSLTATTLYVRLAATAPPGITAGNVTLSGGGASNLVITVTGGVTQNYYNTKANLGLTNTGTWSTTLDGTGPSPSNFTSGYQIFNIVNQANANYTGVWDVNYSGSRVVVGDGTNPVTFTILPGVDSVTSGTRVDVLNNGTLVMQNSRRPFLNSLATGSTVDFAVTGNADSVRIPTMSYYNLRFTNGLKFFSSGTTTIRGDWTIDGTLAVNGAGSPFSTVNVFGNISMVNGAAFEASPLGDNARITLKLNGPGPVQNISSNGLTYRLFRLQRDSAATCNINADANTNISLGNSAGGGLTLTPVGTTFTTGSGTISFIGAATSSNTALGRFTSAGTNFVFAKTSGTTSNMGTIRFNTGSTINDITMNVDAAILRDSITIANDVTATGILSFTKGKLVMGSGATLSLTSAATTTGSSSLSFVDGPVKRTGGSAFTFPVGKGNKYAPVDFSNYSFSNTFTVQYFNSGLGNFTVDPVTLASYPNYDVSRFEYWNITPESAGQVDLNFNYTDANSYINTPNAIRMAHFDGTDWDDIAGVPGFFNSTTFGSVSVSNVSNFSPFTFAATSTGVIPVSLSRFDVQKQNNTALISWTTEQEINAKEFVIERSTDGRNWVALQTIAAAGNSQVQRQYQASDLVPFSGVNFYRLRMVDNDGKRNFSVVKSLYFGKRIEVLISPNPVKDLMTVYLPEVGRTEIRLYNNNGQMVKSVIETNATIQIPTAGLAKGLYTVRINGAGYVESRKIIIE